jgi:16S rRNA (uracil1498-N3)-methyltransferase
MQNELRENLAPNVFIIGPEGGIDSAEVHLLEEIGAVTASLGSTILKTRTAVAATLAVANLS